MLSFHDKTNSIDVHALVKISVLLYFEESLTMQYQQQPTATIIGVPVQQITVPYVIPAQPQQQPLLSNFPKRQAVGLGITLILAGILSIIFNIVAIAVASDVQGDDDYDNYYIYWIFGYIGHGFWVGIMVSVANFRSVLDRNTESFLLFVEHQF